MRSPRIYPSLPEHAATVSVAAPLLSFFISIFVQPYVETHPTIHTILGRTSALLIVGGLGLGIGALIAMRRCGTDGILGKAVIGTLINGSVLCAAIWLGARMTTTGNWYLGSRLNTYTNNGVQLRYDKNWVVSEEPEDNDKSVGRFHPSRVIGIERSDKLACIYVLFYPMRSGSVSPGLEELARALIAETMHSPKVTMERITGRIDGAEPLGLRFHITCKREDGTSGSAVADFFKLQDPKFQVVIDTIRMEDQWSVERSMASIMDSLKIDGMVAANVSTANSKDLTVKMILGQSKRATALIGNKTVMVGDEIEGFKIVALEKDSVVVQSPSGAKKSLRIGDSLK